MCKNRTISFGFVQPKVADAIYITRQHPQTLEAKRKTLNREKVKTSDRTLEEGPSVGHRQTWNGCHITLHPLHVTWTD